ncbi:MAG TPA: PilZ domain-containing protein [Anaeromyxobacteraceae bacterium]|nr:PilZ domain-containing protein [Anaeromyxobacteraceae bacterium]
MHSVSVNVDPSQFLASWRQDAGMLFVPALSDARIGEEVAVRVGIHGQTIRATLFGRVSAVRRVGRPSLPPGVEVSLDRASRAAAGFLAMASRGEAVSFRERAPRYAVERGLVVRHGQDDLEVATINVSEGGCSLRWEGPLPAVGDVLAIRIPGGLFPATGRAVVCWVQPGGAAERSLGVRLVSKGRAARRWRALVAEVARSGARAA